MNSLPENLPDDPILLKQMLGQMLHERQLDKRKIVRLEEQNAFPLQRLFGRKSERAADAATPQLAFFNEGESAGYNALGAQTGAERLGCIVLTVQELN